MRYVNSSIIPNVPTERDFVAIYFSTHQVSRWNTLPFGLQTFIAAMISIYPNLLSSRWNRLPFGLQTFSLRRLVFTLTYYRP